jgi:uncharacterized membrane protein YphA (DoxX/SURF4 family)
VIKNRYVLFAFRVIVGGLFIWAGVLKIADPIDFAANIQNYRITSHDLSFLVALILPWLEVLCGLFLIAGVLKRASSFLISLMLAGFIILVLVTVLRGIDVDCGCFGTFSRKADLMLILEDALMLFMSFQLLAAASRNRGSNQHT